MARNELGKARQELVEAKSWLGAYGHVLLAQQTAEVEALDAELGKFERFLGLVEQAHEAEFPQVVVSGAQSDAAGGPAVASQQTNSAERDPAKAIPYLLEALSCYGVLEQDDWCDRLERGLLEPNQVEQVRRTAYQELVWLAEDLGREGVDPRSGQKMSRQEAARKALAYLR